MGTQNLPEYDTFVGWINNAYDSRQPTHLYFREYPLDIQEKREQFMVKRITELMAGYEKRSVRGRYGSSAFGDDEIANCRVRCPGGSLAANTKKGKYLQCPSCHELVEVRVEYDAKVLGAKDQEIL